MTQHPHNDRPRIDFPKCFLRKNRQAYVTTDIIQHGGALGKIATIHQVTTMLGTFKNVLFLGHNHLLTTGADGPTLIIDN